jgi:hypothetical protein
MRENSGKPKLRWTSTIPSRDNLSNGKDYMLFQWENGGGDG